MSMVLLAHTVSSCQKVNQFPAAKPANLIEASTQNVIMRQFIKGLQEASSGPERQTHADQLFMWVCGLVCSHFKDYTPLKVLCLDVICRELGCLYINGKEDGSC